MLVPAGKEPCNWLPLADNVIGMLEEDAAVHATVAVPQLSSAVGRVNVTNVFAPVVGGVMLSTQCIVGGVWSVSV